MAKNDGGSRPELLPIKVILPRQGHEQKVRGGGSPPVPFRHVDGKYRQALSNQVGAIQVALKPHLRGKPAPVRVKLLIKAAAKSHRPLSLFSTETCPIVGAGRLGELFVKATEDGLAKLDNLIRTGNTAQMLKEISCVESIEPITPDSRRSGVASADILRRSPRSENGFVARVQLFSFGGDDNEGGFTADFMAACETRKLTVTRGGYSANSKTYAVECRTAADVDALSRTIGVKSISSMPLINTVRAKMYNPKPLPQLPMPSDGDFPVVAVVDSGVDSASGLGPWIVGQESGVAPNYRNTDHGTFVAGLVVWGGHLNPSVVNVDETPCGVFDLQVLPNSDPAKGDTDFLQEQELLAALDQALQQHANKYKVWNLSLGSDEVCSLDDFSPLAVELDNLQEKYGVSFVISAGNYATPPLLDYPRTGNQLTSGRITSPADSVLSISVGSVSHVDYKKKGPKQHELSAFSRHGTGPNHIIKPDLVHYGGACAVDGSHVEGIWSLNGGGTAQNIGTSFSAPLVSRALAQVYHQITPTPSPVLARALLTHHARDPRTGGRVPDGDENFFGFGLPAPAPMCLQCDPYSSTLVFEDQLRDRYFLEWDDFPYPPSLRRDGKYFGEIWMTVAFAPVRGARWGTEYCETHIDAHFGVYRKPVRGQGAGKAKFAGLVPPEHKNPGSLYESYQIEKLRKWAPVRTYHGRLDDKGERGDRWRLKVQLLSRHGVEDEAGFKPQPFALIVTINDPSKKAPVYDEMAQIVRNRFKAQNLAVRAAARIRSTT